jgi:hypothetical protein
MSEEKSGKPPFELRAEEHLKHNAAMAIAELGYAMKQLVEFKDAERAMDALQRCYLRLEAIQHFVR